MHTYGWVYILSAPPPSRIEREKAVPKKVSIFLGIHLVGKTGSGFCKRNLWVYHVLFCCENMWSPFELLINQLDGDSIVEKGHL